MATTALHNGMQDNAAGVTTRSRRRLRDEADEASRAGDLHDRKRPKPHPVSVPLRRSPRHASLVASRAERQNSPTRHPEPAIETPSTSRSTSLVDEYPEPAPAATSTLHTTNEDLPKAGARTSSSSLPFDIIDLTDSRTAQKRKRSTVIPVSIDARDQVTFDNTVRRLTRSSSKKARLDGSPNDETHAGSSSTSSIRTSRTVTVRKRDSNAVAEISLTTKEPSKTSILTLSSSEADSTGAPVTEEASENSVPPPSHPVHDIPGDPIPHDTPPTSNVGPNSIQGLSESDRHTPGITRPRVFLFNDTERPCPPIDSNCIKDEESQSLAGDVAPYHVDVREGPSKEAGLKLDGVSTVDSVNIPPVPCAPSSAGQLIDRPRSPNYRYFGVDGRFWRSRKPPSSYLAPNPVRRAPRSQTVRRDECRYLPHAAERAGLLAFAQTRRQFPRWMQRPSHIYFRGSEFFPRGQPATEQDMDAEQVGVGMDIDGMLPSSSARDSIFLLPQNQLYPSTSTYTTSQMELDPDLDPSSLLDGRSSFYAHGAAADFLGSGPGPSAQFVPSLCGSFQQSHGQFWPANDMSSQVQGPFGSDLAGPSNTIASVFQASGSGVAPGGVQGDSQELPWDPSSWVNSPQFSLFGVPPLPLPAQNMSLDSSLSAMATYLVNDAPPLKSNLDSTTLNLIDGIPPAAPPTQSYFAAHPPMQQQMDSNRTGDGYHLSPLN